jgi:hypothetical protein
MHVCCASVNPCRAEDDRRDTLALKSRPALAKLTQSQASSFPSHQLDTLFMNA